jgi:hypothetical protein
MAPWLNFDNVKPRGLPAGWVAGVTAFDDFSFGGK